MNTTTIDSVVAVTARPISSVPSKAALRWPFPISTCRTMFSRTTIASSMRMPMASDRPSSDIVFSVKPNAHTATNEASTDTGSASPVMTVERHELRNRKTTATVSAAPSMQRLLHAGHRVSHAHAGVAHDAQRHAGGQRLLDLGDLLDGCRRRPPSC